MVGVAVGAYATLIIDWLRLHKNIFAHLVEPDTIHEFTDRPKVTDGLLIVPGQPIHNSKCEINST
jgi:hypothetical protein